MNRGYTSFDEYGLRYLPLHLRRAGKWNELFKLLTDPGFLERRCLNGMLFVILEDLDKALLSWAGSPEMKRALSAMNKTLRVSAGIVERYPECLLPVMYGPLSELLEEPPSLLPEVLAGWERFLKRPWFRSLFSCPRLTDIAPVLRMQLPLFSGDQGNVHFGLYYSREGRLLAVVPDPPADDVPVDDSPGAHIAVWDLNTGRRAQVLQCAGRSPLTLRLSHVQSEVIFSTCGKRVRDDDTRGFSGSFLLPDGACRLIVIGKASGSIPPARFVELYNAAGLLVTRWRPHAAMIRDLMFLDDSAIFVTASVLGEVAVWDVGDLLKCPPVDQAMCRHPTSVQSIAFNIAGDRAVSAGLCDCIVWDVRGKRAAFRKEIHSYGAGGYLNHVSFCGESGRIFIGNGHACRHFTMDAESGSLEEFHLPGGPSVRDDDRRNAAAALAPYSGKVLWWFTGKSGVILNPCGNGPGAGGGVSEIFGDESREYLAYRMGFGRIGLHEVSEAMSGTGKIRVVVASSLRSGAQEYGIAVSAAIGAEYVPYVPLAFQRGKGGLWPNELLHERVGSDGGAIGWTPSSRLAVCLDGKYAVAGDFHGYIHVYRIDEIGVYSGKGIPCYRFLAGSAVLACAVRADGRYAVSVSSDSCLCLWDLSFRSSVHRKPAARIVLDSMPSACAFSQDGKSVAVGMRGGRVQFFQVENVAAAGVPSLRECEEAENSVIANVLARTDSGFSIVQTQDMEILRRLVENPSTTTPVQTSAVLRITALEKISSANAGVEPTMEELVSRDDREDLLLPIAVSSGSTGIVERLTQSRFTKVAKAAKSRLSEFQHEETVVKFTFQGDLHRIYAQLTAFVEVAGRFTSSIRVNADGNSMDGKNILDLLTLGTLLLQPVNVLATGTDAKEAIAALKELAASGFSLPED